MKDRARYVLGVYTSLDLLAVLVWILFILERNPHTRSPISDYGVLIGLICLFFLIPLGALAIWLMNRKGKGPITAGKRTYFALSKLFLTISWLPSFIPIVFFMAIFEPWPLSLRQGPDTAFAQHRFEKVFTFTPLPSITELYCQESWEFGDGNFYRFKFRFTDDAVVQKIIDTLRLEPVLESETNASWMTEGSPPSWWPKPGPLKYQGAYRAGKSKAGLWVDRESRIAYYRSWL